MDRIPYEKILERLDAALLLCREIGLDDAVTASRFGEYRERLSQLVDIVRRLREGAQPSLAGIEAEQTTYLVALVESTELGELVPYLRTASLDTLKAKLRDVLRGPIVPSSEDTSSNQARNVMFELALASKLWRAGIQPRLGERHLGHEQPDVACDVGGVQFHFECKRPFDRRSVKDCIGKAQRQLRRTLKTVAGPACGIIAISLSKVLNRGDRWLVYDTEEQGRERLAREVSMTALLSRAAWQRLPGHVIGMVFHVITPGLDRSADRYVVAQQMEARPLARIHSEVSHAFTILGTALEKLAS